MATLPYTDFIASVQKSHLDLLAAFAGGVRVRSPESDTAQVDALRQQCLDLFNAELLDRVAEGYEREGGVVWHTFDGYANAVATGYVQRLATDRIALSREPLPPVE